MDDSPSPISSSNGGSSPPQRRRTRIDPYAGWNMYFGDEKYRRTSPIVTKVQAMTSFLQENPQLIVESLQQEKGSAAFGIDVNLLYNSQIFADDWPNFKSELTNKPQFVLNCLGLAVHQAKLDHLAAAASQREHQLESEEIKEDVGFVKIKILNYDTLVALKNLKVNYYGKFVSVRGCVIRVNKSCQMLSSIVLLCNTCKTSSHPMKQENGIYSPPKKCVECGALKFEPDLASPHVKSIPMQVIRIQEHFGEEQDDTVEVAGRVPRMMDVELFEELVDTCLPGDDVTITGIVKLQGTDNGKVKTSSSSSSNSSLYIEANCAFNNKSKAENNNSSGSSSIEFNLADYKAIKNIHANVDTLGVLVHSLCPQIYGHEMIKMALLLTLFGGSSKHANLRDNIHILLVGDPGLGKSQMMQACSRVAPKGIYISGNSSTASGLTVTLVREKGVGGDFALEPGALVLSDGGCCCIDEFDKMSTQHQALLEAMEQQQVSVAKSGVIWSLPARTSILAAANPVGGRYDKSKVLMKNLNMSQPLLSRFDMIFLLLDEPDKELDNYLSGFVMRLHTGGNNNNNNNNNDADNDDDDDAEEMRLPQASSDSNSLRSRLKKNMQPATATPPIRSTLLRKYIAYAKRYVNPQLSAVSAELLQDYYMNLRKETSRRKLVAIDVCSRQLEALIRLTEARAKVDLREETTEQDALDVIELMEYTVLGKKNNSNKRQQDDEPQDNYRTSEGKKKSTKSRALKNFMNLLAKDSEERQSKLFSRQDLKSIALRAGFCGVGGDVSDAIAKLNDLGIILKTGRNGEYKFNPS